MAKLLRLNRANYCNKYYRHSLQICYTLSYRTHSNATSDHVSSKQFNPTISYIHYESTDLKETKHFAKFHNSIFIPAELHKQYMDFSEFDILQSLILWSLLSNKRNLSYLNRDPQEMKQYLTTIGFMEVCPASLLTKYYSLNFMNKLDDKLTSSAYSKHSHLNFILTRSLQIFDFLHWRLLNNASVHHITGGHAQKRHKSQLQIDTHSVLSLDALKTLRYLRVDSLYLTLYDIALNEVESIPLSYTILTSWIEHGFHLFIAANPGHFSINHCLNPLHEMYSSALYHILSDKPRFVDVKKEYGKKITDDSQADIKHNTFLFNKTFYHIVEYFGVGNATAILKKVLLRCIISDRYKYRNSDHFIKDLEKELSVFEGKKFNRAFNEILFVYGKNWNPSIKERLYSIVLRYLVSVGEIDAAQFVYNKAAKHNYFGVLNNAYNHIKICEALNQYIVDGLWIADPPDNAHKSYMFHSDPDSGYNNKSEYFRIRVQQTIVLLSKMMQDRDKMLLSLAVTGKHMTALPQNAKVNTLTDAERIQLETLTANHFFLDITSVTQRILYGLNQLQIAIQQYEIANKVKLKFHYSEKLLKSLVFIERIHHKYPLSNDWAYLKLSEQKQMLLDIANGIRSGVLISKICEQNTDAAVAHKNIKTPTKILRLRLLNHYGSLWHIIPFKDVLSSCIIIADVEFHTFLQSLNINILPHSDYKLATFFRICSLYLTNLSLKNELKRSDILLLSSKLLNILQYAVGDEEEGKSTAKDYFLLNIKLLALSIKPPYKCYLSSSEIAHDNELKCIFLHNIYDRMMIDNELIEQNKHFVPDLELSEMILFEWLLYFESQYHEDHFSNTFKDLFIKNNVMNDLLDHCISMAVFDDATSHPIMYHLSMLCKWIQLMQHDVNQQDFKSIKRDILSLWNSNKIHVQENEQDDYCEPIRESMNILQYKLKNDPDFVLTEHMSIFDEIVPRLKQTWSPFYIELQQNKMNQRRDKQHKRWKEMIEPQITSVCVPKQMRFLSDESALDHLSVSQWFNKEQLSKKLPLKYTQPQHRFEDFVNSLDIEYLTQLISYNKFVTSRRLENTLSVNEYLKNLSEDGVYIDDTTQAMHSFVHSIEPLLKSAMDVNDDMMIHHSEASIFLNEIETLYNDLVVSQQALNQQSKEKVLIKERKLKKEQFVEEMNRLLRDKPTLQSFVDNIQEIIDKNKHKLYKPKMYSLSALHRKYEARYVGNEINVEFNNWNEFEMNVTNKMDDGAVDKKEHKYLTHDVESLFESTEMIGDLSYNKLRKFLGSVQTLPIKSKINQETYAMTKLVRDIDQMY